MFFLKFSRHIILKHSVMYTRIYIHTYVPFWLCCLHTYWHLRPLLLCVRSSNRRWPSGRFHCREQTGFPSVLAHVLCMIWGICPWKIENFEKRHLQMLPGNTSGRVLNMLMNQSKIREKVECSPVLNLKQVSKALNS